jgi:sulfate adenylyltransferase subunit 2
MEGSNLSQEKLDQLRKRAVMMRIQKKSLNEIQDSTGLSHPTIIAAYKKFLEGGWLALKTQPRGRPSGSKRITKDDLSEHLLALLDQPAPIDQHVWTADLIKDALSNTLAARQQKAPSLKTVQRYLKSAGFFPAESTLTLDRELFKRWQHTQAEAIDARFSKAKLLTIGLRNLRPLRSLDDNLALPNAMGYQVYAKDAKRKLYWWHQDQSFDEQGLIDFLAALFHDKEPAVITLKVPDLSKHTRLNAWLSQQPHLLCVPFHELKALLDADAAKPWLTTHSQSQQTIPGKDMPLTHLQRLEAESIQIMREVVAETENPVMLYSIGKDSAVMLHIAMKAFYPSLPPFPLLHVDTRWKFREMYEFRDQITKDLGLDLLVHVNPEGIEKDINPFTHGSAIHTDIMKTEGLKQALDKYGFDAAFGGARRDEEKSRAKERIFSFRSADHRWDPKNQRPELWKQYNARKHKGESIRVFPISNWTELDIWQYIHLEKIPLVPLYYSAERPVVERDGTLIMVDDDRMPLREGEVPMMKKVRFRTLGCYPLTGAVESEAATLPEIIQEMLLTNTSERQGRVIDHDSAASMEKKKQEGYF